MAPYWGQSHGILEFGWELDGVALPAHPKRRDYHSPHFSGETTEAWRRLELAQGLVGAKCEKEGGNSPSGRSASVC